MCTVRANFFFSLLSHAKFKYFDEIRWKNIRFRIGIWLGYVVWLWFLCLQSIFLIRWNLKCISKPNIMHFRILQSQLSSQIFDYLISHSERAQDVSKKTHCNVFGASFVGICKPKRVEYCERHTHMLFAQHTNIYKYMQHL